MKATIFILSWVSYTDSDDYLYTNVETFTDETEANKQFHDACRKAYEECEWGSQWDEPEDERDEDCKYDVDESRDPHDYTVSSSAYDGYKVEVKLEKKEIDISLPCGLPDPILNIGDTFKWKPDGEGTELITSEVDGVELRVERDYDGTLITNSAYLTHDDRRTEWQRVWVYESEITNEKQ